LARCRRFDAQPLLKQPVQMLKIFNFQNIGICGKMAAIRVALRRSRSL
jgi:hypothetical protein